MAATNSTVNAANLEKKSLSTAHEPTTLILNIVDIFFLLFAFLSFCLAVAGAVKGTHDYDVLYVQKSHSEIAAICISIIYFIIGLIGHFFGWRQYSQTGSGQYYPHLAILTALLIVLSVLAVIFGPSLFGILALLFNLGYFVLVTMMYNNVF